MHCFSPLAVALTTVYHFFFVRSPWPLDPGAVMETLYVRTAMRRTSR